MGSAAVPYLTLEFPQIYNVRLLKPGEHESVRVKANDAKRVLLLAYIDQAIEARKSNLPVPSEDSVSFAFVGHVLHILHVQISKSTTVLELNSIWDLCSSFPSCCATCITHFV